MHRQSGGKTGKAWLILWFFTMTFNRWDIVFDSAWHGNQTAGETREIRRKLQRQHFWKHVFKYVVIFATWRKHTSVQKNSAAVSRTHTHRHTRTRKLNHDRIINEIHTGSFITTFKIPSPWGKTNPFEIITHALLGVHKSTCAERKGGTERTSTTDTTCSLISNRMSAFQECSPANSP